MLRTQVTAALPLSLGAPRPRAHPWELGCARRAQRRPKLGSAALLLAYVVVDDDDGVHVIESGRK